MARFWRNAKTSAILGLLLLSGCDHAAQPKNGVIVALDRTDNPVHEISINKAFSMPPHLSAEDMVGIRSALSRTPNVAYEILSIDAFPPSSPFPVAASVKVPHYFIYLCKGTANEWHVFRTAEYRY
jgi:hypothetical protein